VDGAVSIHREFAALIRTKGQGYIATPESRLSSILIQTRYQQVTNPRDRIFALQGIMQEVGLQPPAPDYSKPPSQVFRETTAYAIKEDNSLDVLNYAPHGSRSQMSLPSWVPDWSDPNSPWFPINFFFFPSGRSSVEFEFRDDGKKLCLWGKSIGSVSKTTVTLQAASFLDGQPTDAQAFFEGSRLAVDLVKAFFEWTEFAIAATADRTAAEAFASILRAFLYTDLPLDEHLGDFFPWLSILLSGKDKDLSFQTRAFFSSITGGDQTSSSPVLESQMTTDEQVTTPVPQARITEPETGRPRPPDPDNEEDMALFVDFYNFDSPEMAQIQRTSEFRTFSQLGNHRAAHEFQKRLISINRDRRLFLSADGKRFGTVPVAVEAGDEIVLFSGARQPFIVRPEDEPGVRCYRLLGPAYVDGAMRGEVWDSAWTREFGLDEFVLV